MKNDPYIIASFLKARDRENWPSDGTNPIVTISRQRGAGGDKVAMKTAEVLTGMSHGRSPWIVVDKNIAERVIDDHHLPSQISQFLTEEQTVSIEDHIEGMFGISVPRWTIVEKMTQTIIHLANIGHVIFVGRTAHAVTAGFPRAAHIRIIGSLDRRIERVIEDKKCSRDEAINEIEQVEHNRNKFARTHFNVDLNDASKYDLVFNTDRVSVDEAARLIAELVSSPDFRKEKAEQFADLRHSVLG